MISLWRGRLTALITVLLTDDFRSKTKSINLWSNKEERLNCDYSTFDKWVQILRQKQIISKDYLSSLCAYKWILIVHTVMKIRLWLSQIKTTCITKVSGVLLLDIRCRECRANMIVGKFELEVNKVPVERANLSTLHTGIHSTVFFFFL